MNSEMTKKLAKIKVILTDVDGVMTDGGIILGTDGGEFKRYDVKDGMGVTMARKAGLKVCIITGRKSKSVALRAEELKMDGVYQGYSNKMTAYKRIKEKFNFNDDEFLHVGDDILDLPVFRSVGFSIAPSDAIALVKEEADFVTNAKGGRGVLRESIEMVLESQGKLDEIIQFYATLS